MGSKPCLRLILPYFRPPQRRSTTTAANAAASYSTSGTVIGLPLVDSAATLWTVSGVINNLDTLRIADEMDARAIACNLHPRERKLLAVALKELHESKKQGAKMGVLSRGQTKKLFIVNATPFIGFGLLDNMIMIFAGEYIDQSLGVYLSISTMAAAALGNIISDVAGVGLAHYVESLVSKSGIKHPVLTSEQLESSHARYTVNMARAFGLVIGCFIGMFPLLFFDDPHRSGSGGGGGGVGNNNSDDD